MTAAEPVSGSGASGSGSGASCDPGVDRDPGPRLDEVDEEAVLARILPLMRGGGPDVLVGPGDDAAVLRTGGRTVVTTDTMVRGRDWRDDWSSAQDVGAKLVAQNLADVAAMGAVPTGIVVTLVAEPATRLGWVEGFAEGVAQAASRAQVPVIGGDLSSAPAGTVVVSITALGEVDPAGPVLRSGARIGDRLAVCGSLGRSAAGLQLLGAGRGHAAPDLVTAHRRPEPPLHAGPEAARAGATAMLDLSDGLIRDGLRVARASRVRLDLSVQALAADVAALVPFVGPADAWECVLGGGEEHSLLATFPAAPPLGWRVVGRVCRGEGLTLGGEPTPVRGWDHFGRSARG